MVQPAEYLNFLRGHDLQKVSHELFVSSFHGTICRPALSFFLVSELWWLLDASSWWSVRLMKEG